MTDWLFLVYKIPRDPSALRVSVWRKLNRLGAVLIHDSVWVLPAIARCKEQLQWLAAEINEQGGNAGVWVSKATLEGQDAAIARALLDLVETPYKEMLAELETQHPDFQTVAKRFQLVQTQDHLRSPLGNEVRNALVKAQRKGQT